jgi:allantoin racemase
VPSAQIRPAALFVSSNRDKSVIGPAFTVKILYINPVGTPLFDKGMEEVLSNAASEGTEVDVISLKRGPWHVEYLYYESLVLPDVLHHVKDAENRGYDGVVLGCFYDLALQEAREITERISVTAPAEATMLTACSLGDKFSIIVGRKKWIPQMMANVVRYGLKDRLASFKTVEMGVLDFQRNRKETERRQLEAAREAVERDGAETIVLGCTGEFGFWNRLQQELGVPVLDPVITPLKFAEYLVDLRRRFGWSHSKVGAYESPPVDEIMQWKLGEKYGTDVWRQSSEDARKAKSRIKQRNPLS